jgi:outer membrane receptor for ferrienterochelin and colicin
MFLLMTGRVLAQESDEDFEDIFPDKDEADFPDLVPATETGDFMAELEFLEEADTVELPARHAQAIGMSPSAVSVITREDIETSGATTVPDLLRMVPGLDVVYLSSFHRAVSSRLVWSTMNTSFLALIDGREMNLEFVGQPIWEAMPIFLDDIERIEVIRGPGSALYGANAVAGVVSITTRPLPEGLHARGHLTGGDGQTLQTGATASYRTGDWGFSLGGGTDVGGTLADPEAPGKENVRMRAVMEYRLSENSKLLLDAGFADGKGMMSTGAGENFTDYLIAPVRLAYQGEDLQAQLSWTLFDAVGRIEEDLEYAGIRLASFPPQPATAHILDSKVQWTLPTLWDPLLLIIGGRFRTGLTLSDDLLDGERFADRLSEGYHKPGLRYWETRTGGYAHAELFPVDWFTLTAGIRLDYNSFTGSFLSPRLTGVFEPLPGQYFRLGMSRAFRMPAFFESHMHMDVEFPADSPFVTETARNGFREFMARAFGNPDLTDEELTGFEAGYRGEFLDGRISVGLEVYYNLYANPVYWQTSFVLDSRGLPDLQRSYSNTFNLPEQNRTIFGTELTFSWRPTRHLALIGSWTHREAFLVETGEFDPNSPKNLITFGGRFRYSELLGSVYLHARSEFNDRWVSNPKGMLESYISQENRNYFLIVGRLGRRLVNVAGAELEAGLRLMLPVALETPHFRYQEKGGGETVFGVRYGADEMRFLALVYFRGQI